MADGVCVLVRVPANKEIGVTANYSSDILVGQSCHRRMSSSISVSHPFHARPIFKPKRKHSRNEVGLYFVIRSNPIRNSGSLENMHE